MKKYRVFLATGSLLLVATSLAALPLLVVTPMLIDFGAQATGGSSAPQSVSIRNRGNRAVHSLSDYVISGEFVILSSNCPLKQSDAGLAAGATCTVQIEFAPQSAGPKSGALSLNTDNHDYAVSLTGMAQ